jgi:threonine synthase
VLQGRTLSQADLDQSGVWKYREAVLTLPAASVVTHPEGRTRLYSRPALSAYAGVERLVLKHEGENPTGSFKDRGMTVAVSQAKHLGLAAVACASTGNTSAALAAYAAQAGLKALVFIPAGKIATGKLAQSLGYGARCLAVKGDFDQAMRLVQEAAAALGMYLVNSLNPFRLEGQKSIIFELLEQRGFRPPDWLVVPAGNLGNTSAFGKALREAKAAGWIDRLPRLVSVQAAGANPFYLSYQGGFKAAHKVKAETVATAIRIGDPVNYPKAKGEIGATQGLVCQVSDAEIMAAKAAIDRCGIGCEPASAATLAGIRQLVKAGTIKATDDVAGILTGHMLKDPDAVLAGVGGAGAVTEIEPTLKAVEAQLKGW